MTIKMTPLEGTYYMRVTYIIISPYKECRVIAQASFNHDSDFMGEVYPRPPAGSRVLVMKN